MTVTLVATARPAAGGNVRVVGPGTKDASPGETVSFGVEAEAKAGYLFVIWSSGSESVTFAGPRTAMTTVYCRIPDDADPDRSLVFTAFGNFGPEGGGDDDLSGLMGTLELTTVPNNARWGATTPSAVTKHGLTPPQRFSQQIVATPNFGYRFKHWTLNDRILDSNLYPADTTYSEDFPNGYKRFLRFVAVFEPVEINVDLYTSVGGGNGTTAPTHETKVAKFGVPVAFDIKATPMFGWRFLRWTETTSTGVGGSTNAERTVAYTPDVVHDVTIRLLAYFGLYPGPGPKPPDYPAPDPDDPEDDGRPAIEISTYVSPDAAANVGAITFPVFQRKTGYAGSEAEFTIEASPQRAGVQTATPYNFDHWEDGDGNIVSHDRIYTFTKKFPASGVDSYGYTAVYTPENPQRGYRSLLVWAGVGNGQARGGEKPVEGDVMLGYGKASGGTVSLESDTYGHGDDGYVDVESYVIDKIYIEEFEQYYPVFKEVKFPSVTAKNPDDGHCRFVRWEGRWKAYMGPWEEITTNETVTHEMLVSKFPNNFWGHGGAVSGKWKDWYGSVQNSHDNAIELRAVFEIGRMVMIGHGAYEPRIEAYCFRIGDVGGTLSETGFNAKGYVQFPLFPGESVFVPFVKDDDDDDPPDGYIHTRYNVWITDPHHTTDLSHFFYSTKHYRGISFTAPSDTSDFKTDTSLPSANFLTDSENGWRLSAVYLQYHKLTGLPIADYNAFTGAGSGQLLHDAAGRLICDDSACPLEPV